MKMTKKDLDTHIIRSKDFVSCNQAFIDCRTPGSDKKENYSMIGPGVSQSDDQFVNLKEFHGFNIGAAAMPKGCINNLHIHFTAEMFFVYKGDWEFKWGNRGENTAVLSSGAVFSPRTWLFRGFRNVGADDGFVFTALGGDDTGGIIWHPDVLKEAKKHGLLLTESNKVIDTVENPDYNTEQGLIEPMTEKQMSTLRQPNSDEMKKQIVTFEELNWSENALLCSKIEGGNCSMAPVIGWGMTQDREHTPKIFNPHGFSVEWLKIPAGQVVSLHRISQKQVLKIYRGSVEVSLNKPSEEVLSTNLEQKDILSIPENVWRCFKNNSDSDVFILVINGGDSPNRIEWSEDVILNARKNDYDVDQSGYLALHSLVKYSKPMVDLKIAQC